MAGLRAYDSPRWSGEITDCALPMTFDQYSMCGYRCLYCFAFFRKGIGNAKRDYLTRVPGAVRADKVKRIFEDPESVPRFGEFVQRRLVMQWGGMADPFCPYERKYGVGLELLRFFREIEYPVSLSTKGTWWLRVPEYVELFKGARHFHVKISIITADMAKAKAVEVGVATPRQRLWAISQLAKLGIGGVTLRLRPFILGISNPSYLDLIRHAADAGADSVSTEFMCLELRTARAKARWSRLSKIAGYDIQKAYRTHSPGSGYLRLNRSIKEPYMLAMRNLCAEIGLRFYVSDADWKELSANGCCCGLDESWNYSRGQFTEALMIAKRIGEVRWSDINGHLGWAETLFEENGCGNSTSHEVRAGFHDWSQRDWLRYQWNNVNGGRGPYKYFGGVLIPDRRDDVGDVVYRLNSPMLARAQG